MGIENNTSEAAQLGGIKSKRDRDWASAARIAKQCGVTPQESLAALRDAERSTYGGDGNIPT